MAKFMTPSSTKKKCKADRAFALIEVLIVIAIAGVLGAAQPSAGQTAAPSAVIPAIDAAASASFETATFALG